MKPKEQRQMHRAVLLADLGRLESVLVDARRMADQAAKQWNWTSTHREREWFQAQMLRTARSIRTAIEEINETCLAVDRVLDTCVLGTDPLPWEQPRRRRQ